MGFCHTGDMKKTHQQLINDLKQLLDGDVDAQEPTLEKYSHDTSIFEVKPEVVVFPKNVKDVAKLVKYVSEHKQDMPNLSLTGRSGGSDMSGGAVNDSIIVDFSRYLNKSGKIKAEGTDVQPGLFYRDFEPKTLQQDLVYPTYPASKNIAALGGMVNNNAGGEMTLKYGQTVDYVTKVKVVLADGNEYEFGQMTTAQVRKKAKQQNFEGKLYQQIYELIEKNYDSIHQAQPNVSKNSTGYLLWHVYDRDQDKFNLAKLFVGSQGTLGLLTEATIKLVDKKPHEGLLAVMIDDLKQIPDLINLVLEFEPDTFEAFDDNTMKLAIKFMPQLMIILGIRGSIEMGIQFLPMLLGFALTGLPKFTFLVEFSGETQAEIDDKVKALDQKLKPLKIKTMPAAKKSQADKFKVIRHESFNLLRKNVKDRHSAAFIDDFIVPPDQLLDFFPKLLKILDKYQLDYTVAGHMGDGNFHIIPLMDLSIPSERAKIPKCTKEVNQLVLKYHGSISAEHNEGLIRGPFMKQMYGAKMFEIFKQVKQIFDPNNIFNPHKKTDASMKFSMSHIRHHYD